MSLYQHPDRDWPEDTCQDCGKIIRSGMLCYRCQYGFSPDTDEAGAGRADWPEPKVVVYESRHGLVVWRYCWNKAALDRWSKPWPGFRSHPQVMSVAQLKERQAEARVEHPKLYRPRRKDG